MMSCWFQPYSNGKNGTDEPICRAGIEIETEKGLVDTVGEGGGAH